MSSGTLRSAKRNSRPCRPVNAGPVPGKPEGRFTRDNHYCAIPLIAVMIGTLLLSSSCGRKPVDPAAGMPGLQPAMEDSSRTLRQVTLFPYWIPTAQFSGYYVGIEKGIYRKHGIDLNMIAFDPSMDPESIIRERKSDFFLLWLVNAIELRSKGLEIVNIAQFSSRSSLMLLTRKSSGIDTLEEMDGKKAGIWIGYERQPQALFRKYNLDVTMVPIGATNNLFLLGGVEILNANWFDEYHSILNSGINEDELNKFFFSDYGFNFLEDGIYCNAGLLEKDPDLCRDFVEATIESWYYAFDHPEEAIEIVIQYAREQNRPVNRPHQRWMILIYRSLYIPPGETSINTVMKREDYESVERIMLENGFINSEVPFQSFYQPYTDLPGNR